MKIPKRLAIPASSVILIGAGTVLGTGLVTAASSSQPGSLAQQIASTFHVNASDAQNVINQHRSQEQTQRDAKVKTKLDAAVAAGKLTSSQETTILGFMTTHQNDMKLTGTARKDALKQLRQQVKAFVQANPTLKHYAYVRLIR